MSPQTPACAEANPCSTKAAFESPCSLAGRAASPPAPFPPSTKAIVLAASAPRRPLELYSLAPPFALSLAPTAEQRLLAVAFDHDLDALDLPPGLLTNVPVSGARPWPSPLGVFLSQDGASHPRLLF